MKTGGSLSIWFFIGVSMLVNGVLIFAAGIYALTSPPEHPVVLNNLHADIWWGGLMWVIGLVYCVYFSPARERARNAAKT